MKIHPVSVVVAAACLFLAPVSVFAQRPEAAETAWPQVGFELVLDGAKTIRSLNKTGNPTGEGGDCWIDLTNAGDGSNRIFLTERTGKIWILRDGKLSAEPFLDISKLTTIDGERGLLSTTFPPKSKDHFYVFYTDLTGNGTIARYKVDQKNPDKALPDSGEIVLKDDHTIAGRGFGSILAIGGRSNQSNHNGGNIAFGPDGMLYWSIGDGGAAYDPDNNGQNIKTWLGKLLRVDVEGKPDAGKKYHVPEDNPFVKTPGAAPEIWALGLRNPWRFSFDSANGDLYIGNVGQDQWEQIYWAPGKDKGGENYGWSIYEGTHDVAKAAQAKGTPAEITFPVAEFSHRAPDNFHSIDGGFVYRGAENPSWQGFYIFSDWFNSQIWALHREADGEWQKERVDGGKSPLMNVGSLGVDEKGNIYALSFYDGKIYKLTALAPE